MKFNIPTLAVALTLCPAILFGQDFIPGILLYNEGHYDSLITDYVPDFIMENPHEEGLSRYFLAESHYNKALQATNQRAIQSNLAAAWREFTAASESADLVTEFQAYYHFSRYKRGWCSFRLAETGSSAIEMLNRAYFEFRQLDESAPDSLKIYSLLMAAEAGQRAHNHRLLQAMSEGEVSPELNRLPDSYQALSSLYEQVLAFVHSESSPRSLKHIQAFAKVKQQALNSLVARSYQAVSPREIANVQAFLTPIQPRSLFADNSQMADIYGEYLTYLSLNRELQLYLLNHDQMHQNRFLQLWSSLKGSPFESESSYRRANLYHGSLDVEGHEFNNLSISFYDSSRAFVERDYWIGLIKMIQNKSAEGRRYLTAFLANSALPITTPRMQILQQDAQYRNFLLEFESHYLAGRLSGLRDLSDRMSQFYPGAAIVSSRLEQLSLLLNCSLAKNAGDIWSTVLSGTDDEKLEQALGTVRFVLPRAALNIGDISQKYIVLLNRLLDVTDSRKSDDTRFFRGIVRSLEAEIEVTARQKVQKFKHAAELLRLVGSDYANKQEADYIRARCLFFANEFEESEVILRSSVNLHHSLRALFYFAEIQRATNNGLAAAKSFRAIISVLERAGRTQDDFWLANAQAGLRALDSTGDESALANLDLSSLRLRTVSDPNALTYEKLADERFLKQQFARQSIDWLLKFGLPQKTFYPSRHQLNHSIFLAENRFEEHAFLLNEVRQPVTSSLQLQVIMPSEISSEVQVWLDGKRIPVSNQVLNLSNLTLNSTHELKISNRSCFTRLQELTLDRLGTNSLVIALSKQVDFVRSPAEHNILKNDAYPFSQRPDQNYILNVVPNLQSDADLRRDFNQKTELRDCIYDSRGDRILVVDAKASTIWVYANHPASRRLGPLNEQLSEVLKSPEGIAVDSDGIIYIADWGNHRVVTLDKNGDVRNSFGVLGSNTEKDQGREVKLAFPTRMIVAEDTRGLPVHEDVVYRESLLYVADQNGVYITKLDGTYLQTVISQGEAFGPGFFYGLKGQGYGTGSTLLLVDRLSDEPGRLIEFVAR